MWQLYCMLVKGIKNEFMQSFINQEIITHINIFFYLDKNLTNYIL